MKVEFLLHLSSNKKGHLKTIGKVSSVKIGSNKAKKRHLPKDCFYWVGQYHDGLLFKSHDLS